MAYLLVFIGVVWQIGFFYELIPALGAADGVRGGFASFYLEPSEPAAFPGGPCLVLPCLLYDLLKFSHRVAGPLTPCQRMCTEMAAGPPVPPFVPRKGDHMKEFFEAFNALLQEWNARLAAGEGGRPGEVVACAGGRRARDAGVRLLDFRLASPPTVHSAAPARPAVALADALSLYGPLLATPSRKVSRRGTNRRKRCLPRQRSTVFLLHEGFWDQCLVVLIVLLVAVGALALAPRLIHFRLAPEVKHAR